MSAPQPQRCNRRQRNETPAPINSSQPTSKTIVSEKMEVTKEQEPPPVDFTNLKRETDEIAKLTKKFAKREISSNWHRYAATEGPKEEETTGEDGPADFTDLLHVSMAGGGHLQLKEERDWSAATGSELGEYFALNLEILSQGLRCIPVYEQLRLPKHLLSDEEVKQFDNHAQKAKDEYNITLLNEGKKSDTKEIIAKPSSLIINVANKPSLEVVDDEINNNPFNILDVDNASDKLIKLDLNDKNYQDTVNLNNSIKQDIKLNGEQLNTDINTNSLNPSIDSKLNLNDNNSDKLFNNLTVNNYKSKANSEKSAIENNKISLKGIDVSEPSMNIDITLINNDGIPNSLSSEPNKFSVSSEKKENKERKSPSRELSVAKIPLQSKNIKAELEADDDLDFLLSLKKPVDQQPQKDSKPPPIKESSHIPGSTNESKQTDQTPSELDDWLDSILED